MHTADWKNSFRTAVIPGNGAFSGLIAAASYLMRTDRKLGWHMLHSDRTMVRPADVGWISEKCRDGSTHYACSHRGAAWNAHADRPADCGCVCHAPASRLSHKCRDGRWHSGCPGVGATWDFVLDHAADCVCSCHAQA